jgi:hypothetical protein
VRKETVFDPAKNAEVEIDVPDLAESSAKVSLEIDDGLRLLLPLTAPAAEKGKERVRVLLLSPVIVIEEEEKEFRKGLPCG